MARYKSPGVLFATFMLLGPAAGVSASEGGAFEEEIRAGLEQVYVFRTTRTQRTRGETPLCASAGFASTAEDRYSLWSLQMDTQSGRIARTHVSAVGEFVACLGAQTPGQPFAMYARGTTAGIAWTGRGECTAGAAQPPVAAVRTFNCNLALEELPEGYAGGWLISSTAAPILPGAPADAHVRGYLSTSVVTLRLWRQPSAPLNAGN